VTRSPTGSRARLSRRWCSGKFCDAHQVAHAPHISRLALIEINTRSRGAITVYKLTNMKSRGPSRRAAHGYGERQMTNWPECTKERNAQLRNLRTGAPEVMKAFSGLAQAAL